MRNFDIIMSIKVSDDYSDIYANGPDDTTYFKELVEDSLNALDSFSVQEISCEKLSSFIYKFAVLLVNAVDGEETVEDLKRQIAEVLDDESHAIYELSILEI